MTQSIILSCSPDTAESHAALTYCSNLRHNNIDVRCIYLIGEAVKHLIPHLNNKTEAWSQLANRLPIPIYFCPNSMTTLSAMTATHVIAEHSAYSSTGLGQLVNECIQSDTVTCFPLGDNIESLHNSYTKPQMNDNAKKYLSLPETDKSASFSLHTHDIMNTLNMSALFNLALILLVFEQKPHIYLNENKEAKREYASTITIKKWIEQYKVVLTQLLDLGLDTLYLCQDLMPLLIKPLKTLGFNILPTVLDSPAEEENTQQKNKHIYI